MRFIPFCSFPSLCSLFLINLELLETRNTILADAEAADEHRGSRPSGPFAAAPRAGAAVRRSRDQAPPLLSRQLPRQDVDIHLSSRDSSRPRTWMLVPPVALAPWTRAWTRVAVVSRLLRRCGPGHVPWPLRGEPPLGRWSWTVLGLRVLPRVSTHDFYLLCIPVQPPSGCGGPSWGYPEPGPRDGAAPWIPLNFLYWQKLEHESHAQWILIGSSLKPPSFLSTSRLLSHVTVTPKYMQFSSSSCISPPIHMAHDFLSMGLSIYWGEWCGHSYCLPFCGTHRGQPHRGGASLTPSWPRIAEGHTCPHTIHDTQPHTVTHGAPPQPESKNEPAEDALVLWEEHTFHCLPTLGSLSAPTGVGGPVWAGHSLCNRTSWK